MSRFRFRKDLLTQHPRETISSLYEDKSRYNSVKARDLFLRFRYPNERHRPKWFRCENPECPNKFQWDQMQIHHILPIRLAPQLRYDINNMILLCPNCHRIIHAPTEEVID